MRTDNFDTCVDTRALPRSYGFTLAEMVVVIALVSILIMVVVGIFFANDRFFQSESGKIELVNESRIASDRIQTYGREAVAILSSYTHESIDYTSDSDTVILELPSLDASGEVIDGNFDRVVVSIDPNNPRRLVLIVVPATTSSRTARSTELSDNMQSFTLTYNDSTPSLATHFEYTLALDTMERFAADEEITAGVTIRN